MKKTVLQILIFIALSCLLISILLIDKTPASTETPQIKAAPTLEKISKLQIPFIENRGQVDNSVAYYAQTFGGNLYVTKKGEMVYVLSSSKNSSSVSNSETPKAFILKERLIGATEISPEGKKKATEKVNYFIGKKEKWRTDVPTFNEVSLGMVYDGIALSLKASGREIEKIFTVYPTVDAKKIQLGFEGARSLTVNEKGELVVETETETAKFSTPVAYQDDKGKNKGIEVAYSVNGLGYGFRLGEYDSRRPLIIDPKLKYSTYLGGSGNDRGRGIAVDSLGNSYITGYTQSSNFPTQNPYQSSNAGNQDVFVTKINSSGNALVYSTYLGGSDNDEGRDIGVDTSGNAYVVGITNSSNFPTTSGVYQGSFGGVEDGFVTKLNPSGNALVYSTYLGTAIEDRSRAVAVDESENAYIGGNTQSSSFPTITGAYQGSHQGGTWDLTVTKLNTSGTALVYSTYLGGDGGESVETGGLVVDNSGNVYVTGTTTPSTNFPTLNPFQGSYQGGTNDVFVTKLNPGGTGIVFSTYLGGSDAEEGQGIRVDGNGNAYIAGYTKSSDFPVQNPYQGTHQGGTDDVFIAKLNATGNSLIYSTYLGGSGSELGFQIALDPLGNAYIGGYTTSTDFPTLNPYQGSYQGGGDVFVTKLNPSGSGLVYSTYLGGSGIDYGWDIAEGRTNIYVTGFTLSSDFPTKDHYQGSNAGGEDAFVTKFSTPAKAKPFHFGRAANIEE